MTGISAQYIPALSYHWLTRFYDPLMRWGMREATFKRRLVKQANLLPGMQVLDLGCGTGTLTILAKQSRPEANLTGLDIDPQVLLIAQNKAEKAGVKIKWDIGLANALPYPDSSYDRVLTSLVFHHLTSDDKRRAFYEIFRILRDGGELHFVDFGAPQSRLMQPIAAFFSRLEEAADNFEGRLPGMMALAGFEVEETGRFLSVFGPLVMVRARKTGDRGKGVGERRDERGFVGIARN